MLDVRAHEQALALNLLPSGLYVMTGAYEGKRSGTLVKWVSQVANEPALIAVAIFRGHWVEPLIRDSRGFGICRVDAGDKLIERKFGEDARRDADPFDCLPIEVLQTGAPLIKKSQFALDCLTVRHFDLEADHSLYIGQVVGARVYQPAPTASAPRGRNGHAH
ncbi:MAG: flavin reductase [Phycisphaeraceae bacterium]|nr:MAG: flavin reductase [Phycisphaeraceae bacterium]